MTLLIDRDVHEIIAKGIEWEQFSGKRILVTGAYGGIPGYFVETLMVLRRDGIVRDVEVVGLVRDARKAEQRFSRWVGTEGLEIIERNVCEGLRLSERFDFIVHAASKANPRAFIEDPIGVLDANIIGTRNILELAAANANSRTLFFSSGEVLGELDDQQGLMREDDIGRLDHLRLRSSYAESKRVGELLCICYERIKNCEVCIVRPFHTYGPGMDIADGRVHSDFITSLLSNNSLVIHSDGTATRSFCYIADAMNAYFRILLNGTTGYPYNVGNDKAEISISGLASCLCAEFGKGDMRVIYKNREKSDQYSQVKQPRGCPDLTRVRGLGWEPRIGIIEGFRRTLEYFGRYS